jgi:hypothetical protein
MQISRHWRLNAQRYRLQGIRYENGEVSLQIRPTPPHAQVHPELVRSTDTRNEKIGLKAAS